MNDIHNPLFTNKYYRLFRNEIHEQYDIGFLMVNYMIFECTDIDNDILQYINNQKHFKFIEKIRSDLLLTSLRILIIYNY